MKGILFLLLITSITISLHSQNVAFAWAKQMKGQGYYSSGNAITTDAAGNVYTTGSFEGKVDFDPGPGISNLSSVSIYSGGDAFVSKLDASGNFLWAKQMSSDGGNTFGASIAVDASGNVYIFGGFIGTADLDPGPAVFNLSSGADGPSSFICKLDAAGNFLWAKQFQQNFYYIYGGVKTDANGNVYTTGGFYGTVDFDPGPGVFNMTAAGIRDMFIFKLDAAGNFAWAKQISGTAGYAAPNSIAVDAGGDIYTAGGFHGTVDFDPGPAVFNVSSAGDQNVFIAKSDAAGNFAWVKQINRTIGDSLYNISVSVATDATGNVFVTGNFEETIDFGPGNGIFNLTAVGGQNAFILKSDAAGNFIWTKQTAAFLNSSIAADAEGNVYTTGGFSGTVDFDPGISVFNLSATGFADMFISGLDTAGNFLWAKQIAGTGYAPAKGNSITADAWGNIYTTGFFYSTVDFDPGTAVYNLTSANSAAAYANDIFIQKMEPCIKHYTVIKAICAGQNYFGYTTAGKYIDTLPEANGCDTIRTIYLTLNQKSFSTVDITICSAQNYSGHSVSGTYIDTLVAANGCDSIRTLRLTVNRDYTSYTKQTICAGQSYLGYTETGTYIEVLTATNGCDSTKTLQLTVQQTPAPDLGADKKLCPGDTLNLSPGQFDGYTWQDGSTQDHYTVNKAGLYSVKVSNQCGSAQASVMIKAEECVIRFPSAFTPNNDGVNDVFKILNAPSLSDYDLVIYNRWGQKIFETKDYTKGWDGNINGYLSDTGVYVWFCKFKKANSSQGEMMKGTILLIR